MIVLTVMGFEDMNKMIKEDRNNIKKIASKRMGYIYIYI